VKRIILATLAIAAVLTVGAGIALASGKVVGKTKGTFSRGGIDRYLLEGQGLQRYIKTTHVWCGWQGGKVVVHVRMKNTSIQHLTVDWYPRYTIRRGGVHGDGFTAVQSNGFDRGEVRELFAWQSPKGTPRNARLASCRPHFQRIEQG
jgi:hypothetical protein